MDLGWKILIPLAFGWFLLITALRLADDVDWNRFVVAGRRARRTVGRLRPAPAGLPGRAPGDAPVEGAMF